MSEAQFPGRIAACNKETVPKKPTAASGERMLVICERGVERTVKSRPITRMAGIRFLGRQAARKKERANSNATSAETK